jgi:hypothetical protein
MRLSQRGRWAGLLLATTTLASGCYGPFNLTQQVWHWNGKVTDNKWANEGIFLVCVIIPIYGVCALADAIVLNSVEFWTGKNWINAPGTASLEQPIDETRELALERVAPDRVKVEIRELGDVVASYTLDTSSGEDTRLLDAKGDLLAVAQQQPDGEVKLVSPH